MPDVNIMEYFESTNAFIEKSQSTKQAVLIHCHMGISRSATILIAYLMWKYEMPHFIALDYVRNKRPIVNPNGGFMQQLQLYDDKLMIERYKKNYHPLYRRMLAKANETIAFDTDTNVSRAEDPTTNAVSSTNIINNISLNDHQLHIN
jgi:hypothetical protein